MDKRGSYKFSREDMVLHVDETWIRRSRQNQRMSHGRIRSQMAPSKQRSNEESTPWCGKPWRADLELRLLFHVAYSNNPDSMVEFLLWET